MFRNQYDTDVTVWSPQGHLYQVDYAMEAVKQGSATLGLRSSTHVVLAAIQRCNSKDTDTAAGSSLADPQKKIFNIDTHISISIAGLTSDARSIARYLRTECLNHKFVYGSSKPVSRLVSSLADKMQACTQSYVRRPYGVGLLVAGVDHDIPKLFNVSPSGNGIEYEAMAIGSRAQSARTYLEKHFKDFKSCTKDELVGHALMGLRGCLSDGDELTSENVALSIVGIDTPMEIVSKADMKHYLNAMQVSDDAQMQE